MNSKLLNNWFIRTCGVLAVMLVIIFSVSLYEMMHEPKLGEGLQAAGTYTKIRTGTTLPASCTFSDGGLFVLQSGGTTAALYVCSASNTWSLLVATSGSGNGAVDVASSSSCSAGSSSFVRFCGNSNVASVSENAGTVKGLTKYLSFSDSAVDLASVANGACSSQRTVVSSGATFGDQVIVTAGTALQAGTFLTGNVSSSGNIQWQFCNNSGAGVDRASDTYTITILQH